MKIIGLLLLGTLASCASYVNSMHRQIDREESRQDPRSSLNDPYSAYREQGFKRKGSDVRPVKNPNSLSQLNPTNDMAPPVKRDYRSRGRTSAQDFVDDGGSGSLWVNAPGGSLFTTEVTKNVGDIVIINVLDNLRNQISGELKRAFPEQVVKKKDPAADPKAAAAAAAPAPAAPGAEKADELDTKVYDKISGVVAEEINRDYFLLRGKKEVIFRKEKRFIEVQALVQRKDISDNDSISSDRLVESRVIILR
jgi:flagellar basal body L-ring protein FlgH